MNDSPPFAPPVPAITADQELVRIRMQMPALLARHSELLRADPSASPLMYYGLATKVMRVDETSWGDPERWFFIGDLHGDFFALHSLLKQAETLRPDCRIVFLGDLVDRGDLPLECIFLMLDWADRHPGRLVWLAGNHDLAFRYDEPSGQFVSPVRPAEFLSVLNVRDSLAGFHHQIGHFFVELSRGLPRAMLFPDGLLATHGGFPLVDLQAQGAQAVTPEAFEQWLNSPACLKDFTWTRIHKGRRKIPDRYSSDPQYGFLDFEAFCSLKPEWFPVSRLLTGHTHPADGFQVHATYQVNPALTLIGFGYDDNAGFPQCYRNYRPHLHLGQYVRGGLPNVLRIPVDHDELEMLYPELSGQSASVDDLVEAASEPPPAELL